VARGIIIRLGSEESRFGIAKVDREKLYGRKERIAVDEQGRRCSSAFLTADGAAIIPSGGAAYVYVDESFGSVERSELRAVDANGQALVAVPSTLGVAQEGRVVDAARILAHTTTSVYELTVEELGDTLKQTLDAGGIVEIDFNYRDDYDSGLAFVLKNEHGYFALPSTPTGFEMIAREAVHVDEVADDDDADDLDFAMI